MIILDLKKRLNGVNGEILLNIRLNIDRGQLVSILGPSGAGKTTLLRLIAGLTSADEGTIKIENEDWLNTSRKSSLPPQKRKVGFVFQDYALFPNMSVRKNLEYALKKGQNRAIIDELLEICELGNLQNKEPNLLSGGQQQRVALARALVQKPKLLLLDEPLSALDMEIRKKLQQYILRVHREYELTTFLVSHDLSETLRMADHIIRLENGKIIQNGTVQDIFKPIDLRRNPEIPAEIISKNSDESGYYITVLLGNNLYRLKVDHNRFDELRTGNQIHISFNDSEPKLLAVAH